MCFFPLLCARSLESWLLKVSKARAASVASGSGALETDGGNRDRMERRVHEWKAARSNEKAARVGPLLRHLEETTFNRLKTQESPRNSAGRRDREGVGGARFRDGAFTARPDGWMCWGCGETVSSFNLLLKCRLPPWRYWQTETQPVQWQRSHPSAAC